MQPLASVEGRDNDTLMYLIHGLVLILFVGWAIYFIVVLIKFRQTSLVKDNNITPVGYIIMACNASPGPRHLPNHQFIVVLQGIFHARSVNLVRAENKSYDEQGDQKSADQYADSVKQFMPARSPVVFGDDRFR